MTATADLGREQVGKRATSTITGIVDGIGTSGSGIGQIILGSTIEAMGWFKGFLLIIAIVITLALLPTSRVFIRELKEIREIRRQKAQEQQQELSQEEASIELGKASNTI